MSSLHEAIICLIYCSLFDTIGLDKNSATAKNAALPATEMDDGETIVILYGLETQTCGANCVYQLLSDVYTVH